MEYAWGKLLRISLALGVLGSLGFPIDTRATSTCRVGLVPGAFAPGTEGSGRWIRDEDYFRTAREFFSTKGCEVFQFQFPEDGSIEERGLMIRDQLQRRGGFSGRTLLLAHSQGGLDARYALAALKVSGVDALVTVGTPHSGSRVAEWAHEQAEKRGFVSRFLQVGFDYDLGALRFLGEMVPGFIDSRASYFRLPSQVRGASARAVCRTQCFWLLRALSWVFDLGPGDGLVEAESQRWGEDLGEFDLDHLSEVSVSLDKHDERNRMLHGVWIWWQDLPHGRS
jgi:hypothetical protein